MTDRCESTAALGRPVVPLVKMRMNGSSSAIGTSGSVADASSNERGEVAFGDQHGHAGITVESLAPLLVHHQQLRVGEVERGAHLGAGPPAVHRHQHRVERGDGPERHQPFAAVRRAHRNPVAGTDAVTVAQRGRQRRDLRDQLVEGQAVAVAEHVAVAITEAIGAAQDLAHRVRAVGEHGKAFAEHVFLHDLERHACSGQPSSGRMERCEARVVGEIDGHSVVLVRRGLRRRPPGASVRVRTIRSQERRRIRRRSCVIHANTKTGPDRGTQEGQAKERDCQPSRPGEPRRLRRERGSADSSRTAVHEHRSGPFRTGDARRGSPACRVGPALRLGVDPPCGRSRAPSRRHFR